MDRETRMRPRGTPAPDRRLDGITRGFRPAGAGWMYVPSGYDEAYAHHELWSRPEVEAGAIAPRHARSFPGYLRGASGAESGGEGDLRVGDLMTPDPESVTPGTSVRYLAQRLAALGSGVVPVVESRETRRLVGVATERDVVRVVADGKSVETSIADCMTPAVEALNRNDGLRRAREVMRRSHLERLPVTDREGRLVGILAEADLSHGAAGGRHPQPRGKPGQRQREPYLTDSSHFRGGYVFGPTDRGGDVGFRPGGVRGLDEW